jgi:hypothetical protein
MPALNQRPTENSEAAILIPILDANGNYKQFPTIATYANGRYETTLSYFRNVTYYIPYAKDIDLGHQEGRLRFTKLAGPSAKPENAKDAETTYVVRMECEKRITFGIAFFKNGHWQNNSGRLSYVTHAAALPEFPPMPEEYS